MKYSNIVLASTVFSSFTLAIALKPKYVQFDVKSNTDKKLMKRSGSDETSLEDSYTYYTTQVKVGSDEQEVDLLIDTGSNALWVINSNACSSCSDGTFDTSSSSSYSEIDDTFDINYGSGEAKGVWASETVKVGDSTVSDLRIGVATTYPSQFGVLGLTVSPDDSNSSPSYENFVKRLKTDGKINRIAYSFYAGAHGNNDGTLLFGAIDHSKYTGSLYTVDMQQDTITVDVGGVNIDSSYSGVSAKELFSSAETALIDTGTSITSLPTDAFNTLVSSLSATETSGTYYVDCGLLDEDVALNYDFSGVRIKVPIKDLIYQESSTKCMLGVSSSDSRLVFGANALRAVYAVFDLEGHKVGLAQANTSPGSENIEVITSSI